MIESKAKKVFEIFQSFYVVPNFQREYVWGAEKSSSAGALKRQDNDAKQRAQMLNEDSNPVIRLADDIWQAANDPASKDNPYYIGSVIVCPADKGSKETWKVIDGQQRLTTVYLFLIALKHLYQANGFASDPISSSLIGFLPSGDGEQVNRLVLQYKDAGEVLQDLLEWEEGQDFPKGSKLSERNLLAGYEKALAYFSEISRGDPEALKKFYKFLIGNVVLTRTETESVERALAIFVTINDRGVGLTPMDLLKNLLFMEADDRHHDVIHQKWEELLEVVNKADPGQPMRFLRYFYAAHYAKRKDGVVRERQVYRLFDRNRKKIGLDKSPKKVLNKMIASAELYAKVRKGEGVDGKSLSSLENIWHLGRATFRQHYSTLLAAQHLPPELFARVAASVERLVAVSWIAGRNPNQQEKVFAALSRKVRKTKGAEDLEKLENKVNKLIADMADAFADSIRNARADKFTGYRFKYILARLAQYIDHGISQPEGRESLDKYLPRTANIEHILPQKGNANRKAYLEFLGIQKFDEGQEDERVEALQSQFVPRLANVTLLTEESNKSAGGKPYSIKKATYKKDTFELSRQMPERQPLSESGKSAEFSKTLAVFTKWNEAELERRATYLVYCAGQIWSVPVSVKPSDYLDAEVAE